MVLLTVVTNSNPHTLNFDHPIEKPSYIRLLSASLYNSWYNLKGNASLSYRDLSKDRPVIKNINQGHYSLEQLANEIKGAFTDQRVELKTELNTRRSVMTIFNTKGADIELSHNLAQLLGLDQLGLNRRVDYVKRLTAPTTYFVHCDLIDKRQNLLNGKPSTVLPRFDIRGQPFERVHYQTPQPHVLRDTDSGDYDVNSIIISVQDEKGNLFDFNGMPLEFEVEIT